MVEEQKIIPITCTGTSAISISELVDLQGNLKSRSVEQIGKLRNQILKHGFSFPFFVWKDKKINYTLDGHGRTGVVKTLLEEGYLFKNGSGETTDKLPCDFISAKDKKEAKEKLLALNSQFGKITEQGFNDFITELNFEIDFESIKMDLELPEFEMVSLDKQEAEEDNYEIPNEIETDIVLGDLFEIGKDNIFHRLLCGDSTDAEQVKFLMGGEKADMVFTDPPYGVSYGDDQQRHVLGGRLSQKNANSSIKGDNLSVEETAEKLWSPAFKNLYENSKDDCSFYMTMCQGGDQMMMMMMMSQHWQVKHELIWVKSSPVFSMGRLDYDYKHEPILYGWKKKHNWYGKGEFLKSVWEIAKPSKSEFHPTMKPIQLIINMLLNSSKLNDIVLDLFLGSGSTMVAAHQLKRKCFGMEIDPKYCQVILDRMKKLDGDLVVKKNGIIQS